MCDTCCTDFTLRSFPAGAGISDRLSLSDKPQDDTGFDITSHTLLVVLNQGKDVEAGEFFAAVEESQLYGEGGALYDST